MATDESEALSKRVASVLETHLERDKVSFKPLLLLTIRLCVILLDFMTLHDNRRLSTAIGPTENLSGCLNDKTQIKII